MTDFWISQAKHFCEYCKVWVQGDKQVSFVLLSRKLCIKVIRGKRAEH
jgi:hypothetical protein